ncbi:MAG: hypothetical protein ACYC6W_10300 [Nitrosotalea sp.]
MKTLYLSIIVGGICVSIIIIITMLSIQNMSLNDHLQSTNEKNNALITKLNDYQKTFGNITESGMANGVFKYRLELYITEGIGVDTPKIVPNQMKLGHLYLVNALVTKSDNSSSVPTIVHYWLPLQILNKDQKVLLSSKSEGLLLNNNLSNMISIRWVPNQAGNYQISAFLWQDEVGGPTWAKPAELNVTITE